MFDTVRCSDAIADLRDYADKRPNEQIQEYGILEVEPRMRDLCLGFWLCRLLLMLEEGLLMRIWIHLDCISVVSSLMLRKVGRCAIRTNMCIS